MKLSIIVPHYKEDFETCKNLFQSIEIQKGIEKDDFEVIVVNDGGNRLKLDYPFVRQIDIPHSGVSHARNVGLLESKGEYVMFCDCDDMFLNNYALHTIMGTFKELPEVIVSQFVEEQKVNGEWRIMAHPTSDPTFVHGKVFQRRFLDNWNIRFNDDLTIHEDGYFVALALNLAHGVRKLEVPLYLWVENPKSVVRIDHKNWFDKTYINLLESRKAVGLALKERNFNNISGYVCGMLTDCYYDLMFVKKEYRHEILKKLSEIIETFESDIDAISMPLLSTCLTKSRENAKHKGYFVEEQTFGEWYGEVVNRCKSATVPQ